MPGTSTLAGAWLDLRSTVSQPAPFTPGDAAMMANTVMSHEPGLRGYRSGGLAPGMARSVAAGPPGSLARDQQSELRLYVAGPGYSAQVDWPKRASTTTPSRICS